MNLQTHLAALVLGLVIGLVAAIAFGQAPAALDPASPEDIADCIAEQSYTHPQNDKFRELVNAIRLCRLEQGK